jgi:hypothetical protein
VLENDSKKNFRGKPHILSSAVSARLPPFAKACDNARMTTRISASLAQAIIPRAAKDQSVLSETIGQNHSTRFTPGETAKYKEVSLHTTS